MTPSDVTSTGASRLAPPSGALAARVPEASEPRQQEHIHECLASLNRIERVKVVDTELEDGAVFLVLDIQMKKSSQLPALTEKERKKQEKAIRPVIDFRTSKAVKTLELIHNAIYDWSIKHQTKDAAPCAYCSQFNSPVALALWFKKSSQEVHASETSALTIVVNNNKLRQYEKCINHYLESARAIPEGKDFHALECEGYAHIPSIVASFLQRHQIKTCHMSKFGQTCGSGM